MQTNTPLSVIRGAMDDIKEKLPNITDGQLIFALDTKQIYLDYDVNGGVYSEPTRIKFGSSTGIWYGTKTDSGDAAQVIFSLSDLEEATEYPSARDLILNQDGSFFKVQEVDNANDEIVALRLTVSGGGGGGGSGTTGYIEQKRVGAKNQYFSVQDAEMRLYFLARVVGSEEATLGATVTLIDAGGNRQEIGTINNLNQSWDSKNPISINIKPLMEAYKYSKNVGYDIEVEIFDDEGNTALKALSYTATIFDMYVSPFLDMIGTQTGGFAYYCVPTFYSGLQNVRLYFRVVDTTYNDVAQTNYPDNGFVLSNSDSNQSYSFNVTNDLSVGAYKIETWLQAILPGTTTEVTSHKLEQTFVRQSAEGGDPILVVNYPSTALEYEQRGSIRIPYSVSYREATIAVKQIVKFTPLEGGETIETVTNLVQATETMLEWVYYFMELGSYQFTIQIGANAMNKQESNVYTVLTASSDVPTIATGALALSLTATKTNDSADKDSWVSNTDIAPNVNCSFEGFNWISNGWRRQNEETSLYLNNGARLEIPFSPWSYTPETVGATIELDVTISNVRNRASEIIKCVSKDSDDKLYTGIIVNGDYFTINSNNKQPIYDYINDKYINLDRAGMTATYVNGKRVRISFVITPADRSTSTMPASMVYTYVNGIASGFVDYGNDSFQKFWNEAGESGKIIFDSADADIDIYNVRVYNTALTDRAILGNYFASFGDYKEAAERWADNDLLDDDGQLSLEAVMKAGNIPYFLFRGGASVSSKKGTDELGANGAIINTGLPTGKKDYRLYDMCYINPLDTSKNIGTTATDGRVAVVLYAQGTSSMGYPIKNQRMIFARNNRKMTYQLFDDVPATNLFCLKADYMESSSAHNTGLGNALNDLYGNIKTPSRLYQHADGLDRVTAIKGVPCICFWKESELDPEGLAETQENYQGYKFIGRYNFNLDKSTHEVFGFYSDEGTNYGIAVVNPPNLNSNYQANLAARESIGGRAGTTDGTPDAEKQYFKSPDLDNNEVFEWSEIAKWDNEEGEYVWKLSQPAYEQKEKLESIQCWECLTNNNEFTHFHSKWTQDYDPDNTKFTTAFEARYPEYEVLEMCEKRDFVDFVNWLHSVDNAHADGDNFVLYSSEPTYEQIESGDIPADLVPLYPDAENPRIPQVVSINSEGIKTYKTDYGYAYDSIEYRNEKFKQEFANHFEKDLTLFYYLVTEMFLLTDSRAKNMMLCTFTAHCKNADGTSATKWFPIFYDMDTQLAVNNIGALKFTYKDEDYFADIFNAEGGYLNQYGTLNSSYSAIFSLISKNLQSELKATYSTLRKGNFNPTYMIDAYNDKQANAWNEIYCNQDAFLKYIQPYIQLKAGNGGDGVQINAMQGKRDLHREQFLKRRFAYLDSKYSYFDGGTTLDTRVNTSNLGTDAQIPQDIFGYEITVNDAMYFNVGITNSNTYRSERLEEGETRYIQTAQHEPDVNEQEFYIYLLNNIVSLGDLANKGWQRATLPQTAGDTLKMRDLILSTNEPGYEYELKPLNRMSSLDIINSFPMLETLNVGYWNNLGSLNLSNNKNLKRLYATGTILKDCIFPEGGILEHVELPATLGKIKIVGHYGLDTILYQKYESDYSVDNNKVINIITPPTEAWELLNGLYIKQCPTLDTKAIFSKMREDNLAINLQDIDWHIDISECTVVDNMITDIPLAAKLVRQGGYDNEPATENGEYVLSRAYVGGTITIDNGSVGVNEATLYEKYQKYFPYLQFKYTENENCVKAYSLNVYDGNASLNVAQSSKFTSENVNEEFTLVNAFGLNGEKITPIEKIPTNEYEYIFLGWNREGVYTAAERDYKTDDNTHEVAYAQALAAAKEKLIVEWDGSTYSAANGFDFTQVFSDEMQTLDIYPTFTAKIRQWTATFTDGKGTVLEEQLVYYGEYAEDPSARETNKIIPFNFKLDENDAALTVGYPFVRYGDGNFRITSDKTFDAVYSSDSVPMTDESMIASEGYFQAINTGDGTVSLRLRDTYTEQAVCVPATYEGKTVSIFDIGSTVAQTIRRVYFAQDNQITSIADSAFAGSSNLEYFDFKGLTKLQTIGQRSFANCTKLVGSEIVSARSIGGFAFQGCTSLAITTMPENLVQLEQGCFWACTSLKQVSFAKCVELDTIAQNAFNGCANLTIANDALPAALVAIGDSAFNGCSALTMDFGNNTILTTIGGYAFAGTRSMALNGLPNSVTTIGERAFYGDSSVMPTAQANINLVYLPANLTTLNGSVFRWRVSSTGTLSFANCSQLTDWDSSAQTGIHAEALAGLNNLTRIEVPKSRKFTIDSNAWGAGTSVEIVEV